MAETIKFELVSPSAKLASTEAVSVTVPAAEGDLTAMPRHAPFLSALRPGVIVVTGEGGESRYVVTAGFVEVTPSEVGVVAEDAAEAASVTGDWMATRIEAAEKALGEMGEGDERRTAAAQHVADLTTLKGVLGV
ncbi:MAG: ATP synthase F1 subunit epsilon [Pseudomonadota bacterium]